MTTPATTRPMMIHIILPDQASSLRKLDILAPRPLGTLSLFERDRLSFAEIVECNLSARGLMKKVLMAIASCDEAEPFVTHNFLNRTVD